VHFVELLVMGLSAVAAEKAQRDGGVFEGNMARDSRTAWNDFAARDLESLPSGAFSSSVQN
jgi:hypothetical protein